jgi:hypothetical protein
MHKPIVQHVSHLIQIYFVAWKLVSSRAVYRAWIDCDPQGYQNYLTAVRIGAIIRAFR